MSEVGSSEVDRAIAAARSSWARISNADDGLFVAPERRRNARAAIGKRLTRIAIADVAILVAAFVIGLIVPLGIIGAFLVMIALIAATVTFAVWPPTETRAPAPEKLRTIDIKALPAQTERWLGAQRAALPVSARAMVDRIGTRLAVLSPQLGKVDPDTEAAQDIRRLIGEQLPAFVNDYTQVPATLRTSPRNGKTPDAQLVDGLSLIEREIAEMTERLAQGDLDNLSTRGRFLEMKYSGDKDPG